MQSLHAIHRHVLTNRSGKHSVVLWKLFVAFEKSLDEHGPVKDILLRAVTHLPWSKWTLVLGFAIPGFKFSDLESLHSLLEDRELRIHNDISEGIAEIKQRRRPPR